MVGISANKVTVVFDYERAPIDGIGAQVQRQWSVMLVAKYMNWHYQGAAISDLMLRASDLREGKDREDVIRVINEIIENSKPVNTEKTQRHIKAQKLQLKFTDNRTSQFFKKYPRLFLAMTASFAGVTRLNLQIVLVDGFFLTNRIPDIYCFLDASAINKALGISRTVNYDYKDCLNIVLHIRRGEVDNRNFSQELSQRYTTNEKFASILRYLLEASSYKEKKYKITILSDAPKENSFATREFIDMNLWESQLGIDGSFQIFSENFSDIKTFYSEAEVRNDLDSVSSLRMMIEADVLVMSKSSFSFIAGVLNRSGLIVYQEFWHQPLSKWLNWSRMEDAEGDRG